MTLTLRAACVSDLGRFRDNNEDAGYAGHRLLAVADGVGGQPAGEVASKIVIDALAALDEPPGAGPAAEAALAPGAGLAPGDGPRLESPGGGLRPGEAEPATGSPDGPLALLRGAMERANLQIREAAGQDPGCAGMATTLTALLLAGGTLALLHVGDSRAYRLRAGELRQLTVDHTYVRWLVEEGRITEQEARHHPRRSVVTQVLQGDELDPQAELLTPHPGDRYLVCSDGLTDAIPDDAIAEALARPDDPPTRAEHLVALALAADAPDNITVALADVLDP